MTNSNENKQFPLSTAENKFIRFRTTTGKKASVLNSNSKKVYYPQDSGSIKENFTILERLNYKKFLQIIYSSKQIITPECGTIHLAAACEVPTIIIYNAINYHEAINKEYHPWKSEYKKLVFNDIKLNEKILNILI